MNKPAKKSHRKWIVPSVILLIFLGGVAGFYIRQHKDFISKNNGPITFEGKVTEQVGGLDRSGCGVDDSCSVVVGGKTVLVDCGFGPWDDERCPLKHLPSFQLNKDTFSEEPPIGWRVRITAQKDKADADYNLHCKSCGLMVLQ